MSMFPPCGTVLDDKEGNETFSRDRICPGHLAPIKVLGWCSNFSIDWKCTICGRKVDA